jgi:hypothetical protein
MTTKGAILRASSTLPGSSPGGGCRPNLNLRKNNFQKRFIKRVIGEKVVVEADIYADGHDTLAVLLLHCKEGDPKWVETPMEFLANDRWRVSFVGTAPGYYHYTIMAWVDRFKSWRRDLMKKAEAGQEISVDLRVGSRLISEASQRPAWQAHGRRGSTGMYQSFAGRLRDEETK